MGFFKVGYQGIPGTPDVYSNNEIDYYSDHKLIPILINKLFYIIDEDGKETYYLSNVLQELMQGDVYSRSTPPGAS